MNEMLQEMLRKHKRDRIKLAVTLITSCAVVVLTALALTHNGHAVTVQDQVLSCNLGIHTHTEECYGADRELECGYADYVIHVHNDDCYNGGVLVCTLPEIPEHKHDESCYKRADKPACGLEESESHIHSEECYAEDGTLTCGLEETDGHKHTEDCFPMETEPSCGKLELHTHTEQCYQTAEDGTKQLICGIPELKEHVHGPGCFQDPVGTATVENSQEQGGDTASGEMQDENSGQGENIASTMSILNDGTPVDGGNLKDFVNRVEITDEAGNPVGNSPVYVGETYHIFLEFKEKGAQFDQFAPVNGKLYYQIPDCFKIKSCNQVPLTVLIDGNEVTIGTYSIDENGMLAIELTGDGISALERSNETALTFDMEATVQTSAGGNKPDFGGTGGFTFEVTDQPRISMDKQGSYTENADGSGGTLAYTVKSTVEHGEIHDATITDTLTPPQTSALDVEMVKEGEAPDVAVKIIRNGIMHTLDPDEYTLTEMADPANPGKKTFKVELKGGNYDPLYEGDELYVIYNYHVEYVDGTVSLFQGNALNEATFTGSMPVTDPATGEVDYIPAEEHKGCTVWVERDMPGQGIVCKDQDYNMATHTMHYTLYTIVPKGDWNPFYIQDDIVVEFGGEKYYLTEFKKGGRVKNLTVSAVDLENQSEGWDDNMDDPAKIDALEALKGKAQKLTGYEIGQWDYTPDEYDPESEGNYICMLLGNNLEIVFGEREYGNTVCGNWEYQKDRLIITEYDLDMSEGTLSLLKMSDYITTMEKSTSEVLLAGIRNTVSLRFGGYFPGYSVYFNSAKVMNKAGDLDKTTNTIDYTVTLNTTDKTVNQYFRDATDNWIAIASDKYHWGNMGQAYSESMQAVFYDELPDGWEYVDGSLVATVRNIWGNESSYPYDKDGHLDSDPLKTVEGKQVISAPLMFFYDANNYLGIGNLFDWFNDRMLSLTFTYKLKADDKWLKAHAADVDETIIHNEAAIRDNSGTQWEAEHDIAYYPAKLTKKAEQAGDSNLLEFTLDVNPGGADFDPEKDYLVVADTSQNLQIQTGSITVLDASGSELRKMGEVHEGDDIGQDAWGFLPAAQDTENSHQFRLMVPDGKALTIQYNALIPEKGVGVFVSNSAAIEGIERAESGYSNTLDVTNVTGGGSGSTYGLTVAKADSEDMYRMLPDAQFQFYVVRQGHSTLAHTDYITVNGKTYDCHTEPGWKVTTGKDGMFPITKDMNWLLEPGSYYILKETKAPDGYILPESPVLFYYGAANEVDTENYPGAVYALPNGTLTVTNKAMIYELPETGGTGTGRIYAVGLVFLAIGISAILVKRKYRESGG